MPRASDTCPPPFTAGSAGLTMNDGGVWAPNLYQSGDSGTFLFQGGTLHGFAGANRVKGRRLVTRDTQFGEVTWKKTGEPDAGHRADHGEQRPDAALPRRARCAKECKGDHRKCKRIKQSDDAIV